MHCRLCINCHGLRKRLVSVHRKIKVREFPVPSRDVTTKLSLGGNNNVITELFLPRGSLVSDIPAGDGKLVNHFLRCVCVCVTPPSLPISDSLNFMQRRQCIVLQVPPCPQCNGAKVFSFLSSLHLLPPATTAVFGSNLASL
jgi:hypothetical protein